MANDPEVNIKLKTTADTDGADELAERFEDLKKQAEDIKKEAGGQGGSGGADESLRKLVNLEKAKAVGEIAKGFGKLAEGVKQMRSELGASNPELDKTLEKVEGFASGAESAMNGAAQGFALGGPFGAALGALTGFLGGKLKDTIHETIQDFADLSAAKERDKQATKLYQDTLANLADEARRSRIAQFWKNVSDLNHVAMRELKSYFDLLASKRDTEQARFDASGASGSAEVEGKAAIALERIQDEVNRAQAEAAQARKVADDASTKFNQTSKDYSEDSAEFKALQQDIDAKRQAADDAEAAARDAVANAQEQRERLGIEVRTQMQGLTDQARQDATGFLKPVVEMAEKLQGEMKPINQEGLRLLQDVLKDGQFADSERSKATEGLQKVFSGMKQNTEMLLAVAEAQNGILTTHATRINQLQADVKRIEKMVTDRPGY